MASPQVAGVLACLATGKERFNQYDAKGYLDSTSIYNDMSWDASGGLFDDSSCKKGSPDLYLIAKNPREGVTGMISKQVGARSNDKSALKYPRVSTFNISGTHPFWIKTVRTTGTSGGVTTGTITNNGQQSSNLTWDTNGVTPGTYWYICQLHLSMSNTIIVT